MSGRPPGGDTALDREEALWAEIIRCEMDSWTPRLPRHFQTRSRQRSGPLLTALPLVVTGCLIVLAAGLLAQTSGSSGAVLHTLAGMRPAAIPGSTAHDAPPPDHRLVRPSSRPAPTGTVRRSGGGGSPSPTPAQPAVATAAREVSPAPSPQPSAPPLTLVPLPSATPSPLVIPPISTPAVSGGAPPGVAAVPPPGSTPTPSAGQ